MTTQQLVIWLEDQAKSFRQRSENENNAYLRHIAEAYELVACDLRIKFVCKEYKNSGLPTKE